MTLISRMENKLIKVLHSPTDKGKEMKINNKGEASIIIAPYSATLVEFGKMQ
jgi:hypothetical protein